MSGISNADSQPTHAHFSDPATRSAELEREARIRALPETMRDLIRLANDPGYQRWLEQIRDIGGCAHPVYLSGYSVTRDASTGEILVSYSTTDEPGDRLAVRCGNRRASVCEPCSRLHAGDTYHLVRSGLSGGKSLPEQVRGHPRLFVTLTAPSFGPVHRATGPGEVCRFRRGAPLCEHGEPLGCNLAHSDNDELIGKPLCAACYDYVGHVLWHAHAGRLWDRFTTAVRRHLAASRGIPRSELGHHLVVSFAKVAEYQKRAAVHFHAVVRLDGPDGPDSPPPGWATAELITEAVYQAARSSYVAIPESDAYGLERVGWGQQIDVRPIGEFADGDGLSDEAVAGYVAKYVTKGAGDTASGLDHHVHGLEEIQRAPVSSHLRALMATCWRLGALPELEPLRLRLWAHSLGYRGHILTKSRRYSTTYSALRAERAEHKRRSAGVGDDPNAVKESSWRFVGSGHTPGEALMARSIADDIARNREEARAALADFGGRWPEDE
ncbi:replication initiator [Streptantibioticus rubrisoli]